MLTNTKVIFLGDCMVGGVFCDSLCEIPGLFPDGECFVINLECAIANEASPKVVKSHALSATYEEFERVLDAFKGRIVVFNIGNNHAADAGVDALIEFKSWCNLRGVRLAGSKEPCVVELGSGIKVGILSGIQNSSTCEISTIRQWDSEFLCHYRDQVDHLVFLAHWGEEYVFYPDSYQINAAGFLCAGGVDLVVGCHPHVVQGVGQFGRSRVYYSLGNGTMNLSVMLAGSRIGAALVCSFQNEGELNSELRPFSISKTGKLNLLSGLAKVRFENLMDEISEFPVESLWWRKQAAKVFFRNHMASWVKRIRKYGLKEFFKMLRSFASKNYLLMGVGRLSSLGGYTANDIVAQRFDALLDLSSADQQLQLTDSNNVL